MPFTSTEAKREYNRSYNIAARRLEQQVLPIGDIA